MEGVVPTMNGSKRLLDSPNSTKSKRANFIQLSPLLPTIKTPQDRPFRVSVEGNIGAGKSTLIKYFATLPEIETYPEPIDKWRDIDGHNILELMYTDIKKWLMVFQNYVQFTRLQVQTSEPKNNSTTVQMFERSIQNNRFCFLENSYRNGLLEGADYAVLDQWYTWIRANIDISLDLIVYLRTSPEVVYERVKQRGRPEENTISLEYLQQLHESHERWLMSNDISLNTIPVLVLDGDAALDDIEKQYKLNETKILGYDKRGIVKVNTEEKEKVKKMLNL